MPNEPSVCEVREALMKWVCGNMSTVDLFTKVGLSWDGVKHHSHYSGLMAEIEWLSAESATLRGALRDAQERRDIA